MRTWLRHAAAIVVLPVTVTVAVPIWIARRTGISFAPPDGVGQWILAAGGVVAGLGGLWLFSASLRSFATEGRGTLAPWDPPRRLVVRGPYRFVRNPMISGVLFILIGEALMLRSAPHLGWATFFATVNLIYIPVLEEPMLEARFGAPYREYRRHVPRFLPRLHPWSGDAGSERPS